MRNRGTHTEAPGAPNNVKPLRTQGNSSGGGKGGVHVDSGNYPPAKQPAKFRPGIDASGDAAFSGTGSHLEFGKQDPRRSHK
jgi:hypothetical protein